MSNSSQNEEILRLEAIIRIQDKQLKRLEEDLLQKDLKLLELERAVKGGQR